MVSTCDGAADDRANPRLAAVTRQGSVRKRSWSKGKAPSPIRAAKEKAAAGLSRVNQIVTFIGLFPE